MEKKLKYINLFEELSQSEIPYSSINNYSGGLNIKFPKSATSVPPVFNELTTEVTGEVRIDETQLTEITGFNKLESVGNNLLIMGNTQLTEVTGFENLKLVDWDLYINKNTKLKIIPEFDNLENVGLHLWITNNNQLNTISGFNNLKSVGQIFKIENNNQLNTISGFNKLESLGNDLYIINNPNLITLSIPSTLIRSVNYEIYHIEYANLYIAKSPYEFVNNIHIIQDCIDKFDPGLHGDIVVTQIMENLETWGTLETQKTIINHLLSKRNYWSLIPTSIQHLAEEYYKYLYAKEHKNTGAKSVAKVATGVTYGLF